MVNGANGVTIQQFREDFAPQDEKIAENLMSALNLPGLTEERIDARATKLIEAIRAPKSGLGGIEDFLREYSLSTKEGLALMVLAEALLRVPDGGTADKLIEDKLAQADWTHHEARSDAMLVTASSWALGLTARVIQPGETPEGIIGSLAKRLGLPAVRAATRQAMRLMGSHFVLGQNINEALKRAASNSGKLYRYSFDMLGEGARTAEDAARYYESYAKAIHAIGKSAGKSKLPDRPGISVKLSALHPRYEAVSHARVMNELVPKVIELAALAKSYDLNFTIDAEEADRLELSLDVIGAVARDARLAGWDGFGLAIQAYQKRAAAVIDFIAALAAELDRKFMVRLVKGAYWDTEIKRAQERGLDDYPVFTRKAMTDLNYLVCARKMLGARPRIYPQFATHNALSVASILEMAGTPEGFEFQRLHGMGEDLYRALLASDKGVACRTYAPVGEHEDLLAYLVRRLLENGANSSFVSVAADPNVPISDLLKRPQEIVGSPMQARNTHIRLPAALYAPRRANSKGIEFGHASTLNALLRQVESAQVRDFAASLIDGRAVESKIRTLLSPIDGKSFGSVSEATPQIAEQAMAAAQAGFKGWAATPVETRAGVLDKAADRLEARRGELLKLLQVEAGKTLDDAVAEVREAVDFCRFYASEARRIMAEGDVMPGPTGEDNRLAYRGRGVFVCISPWNFPLAIFTGQVVAALVAGNSVVAKPAEQTPLIARMAIELLHGAGAPVSALHLVLGGGAVGGALVAHPKVAGVAFTGSTATAFAINRALAAKNGPIVPLIAETGGINAMIADATALPEQVADDVVLSAFRSAGQRCSALRLLCVQEDVADKMINMIAGAARELKIGDPREISTHIGPVIDHTALQRLETHVQAMKTSAREIKVVDVPAELAGTYLAPHIFELRSVDELKAEVFGPVLHVVRYKAGQLDAICDAIEATGYGLTLGVHSRIDATIARVVERLDVGNVYVNRNMIGAVVGTQPFGGAGLSGTGPKAGGPNYLKRFASEQVVSINVAAAGGNASLMTLAE